MFTPVFENDAVLNQHVTVNKVVRKKSELFLQLSEMPVGDTWYQVDSDVHPDANKFRTSVARHSKNGAGKFKVKSATEGLFIKKIA